MSAAGGGGGSNSDGAPVDLAALREEQARLMRRLQARQAQQAAGAGGGRGASASATRGDASREAGFNVYISGANEQRVAEQRKREKATAAAAAKRGQHSNAHPRACPILHAGRPHCATPLTRYLCAAIVD